MAGVIGHHDQVRYTASRPHVNRRVGVGLNDLDEVFTRELEDRDEGHRHAHAPFLGTEQTDELHEARLSAVAPGSADMRSRTESGSRCDVVMREHRRARQHFLEGDQHLLQRHLRARAARPCAR